jgi:hypothetical protein
MSRPPAPNLRRYADPEGEFLTYAQVRATRHPVPAEQHVMPPRRVTLVAAYPDPLRSVPRGSYTLDDYTYEGADLCHNEFGSCRLPNLGARA